MLDRSWPRASTSASKGFDGVEFDNVDGYANKTGFPLTAAEQLATTASLANHAHPRGLSVGAQERPRPVRPLLPYFDFAINEQCVQYKECDYPAPGLVDWAASGKAVFEVEYRASSLNCAKSNGWNFNAILKSLRPLRHALDALPLTAGRLRT